MIQKTVDELSMDDIAAKLAAGPWSFSRYGDTEIACMTGATVRNVDGQPLSAGAAADLWRTLAPPGEYTYGMQPLSLRMDLVPQRIQVAVDWVNADVFHNASKDGKLWPLVEYLRSKRVLLVGPMCLRPVKFLQTTGHVVVPSKDGYGAKKGVRHAINETIGKADVVVFCASLLSNVLIDALDPVCGDRVSLLDCGSLWEPYAGVITRKYHKGLSRETINMNLGGLGC